MALTVIFKWKKKRKNQKDSEKKLKNNPKATLTMRTNKISIKF